MRDSGILSERSTKSIHFVDNRIDSVMLLEEGFKVVSCDASDKMLKGALEERWRRRKEEAFDKWGKINDCHIFTFLWVVP